MVTYKKELEMYEDIIKSISKKMEFYGYDYKVFRTWKSFDPYLKSKFSLVCSILNKDTLPDIIVLYKNNENMEKTIIIEVKKENLIAKDIAQAKLYCDVFDADSVLLVSLIPLRKSFKEFSQKNEYFLKCANSVQLYTCVLQDQQLQLQNSFPMGGNIFKW